MFKKLLLASALLVTFASAQAQQSQPFGVTGTVTPAPCNVTLTGGNINLGTLTQAYVKGLGASSGFYVLEPAQEIPINITCSAATQVRVSLSDNKAGKFLPVDANDSIRFGLTNGAAGTTAIGALELIFANGATIDGVLVGTFLHAANGSTTWSKSAAATGLPQLNNWVSPGYTTGFAKSASATAPESITTLAGSLRMKIWFSNAVVDGLTTNLVPTGSGTLTLTYL